MQVGTYQELAERTINKNLTKDEQINHALFGMSGEVGEILSIYQKQYQGHEIDEEELKKEVGDLIWFVAEYCTVMGWEMDEVLYKNINKLKRRYPDGFEAERSVNRDNE